MRSEMIKVATHDHPGRKDICLAIGGSRFTTVSSGSHLHLAVPPPEQFLKHEEKTLIWATPSLSEGNAVIKMYRHRGWGGRVFSRRVEREFTALGVLGRSPIQVAWERVKTEILPKEADFFDAEEARQLVALCYQLEQSSNSEPWYLSCRDAEKLINKSHTVCARWLSDFVVLGILQVVTPGTKHKATRYTWKGACK